VPALVGTCFSVAFNRTQCRLDGARKFICATTRFIVSIGHGAMVGSWLVSGSMQSGHFQYQRSMGLSLSLGESHMVPLW
jgi:hypothetical protein